jgi:hypothetical protein
LVKFNSFDKKIDLRISQLARENASLMLKHLDKWINKQEQQAYKRYTLLCRLPFDCLHKLCGSLTVT